MESIGFSIGQVTLFVLIGTGVGAILGAWLSPGARQARQLSLQLEQVKTELTQYQNKVAQHFVETAQHFRELTTQYHHLFEHLRNGANQLCHDEQLQRQLAALRMPSKTLLDAQLCDTTSTTHQPEHLSQKIAETEPA